MTPEPAAPAPRRTWHIRRWVVLVWLVVMGNGSWRVYDLRAAVKEAKALGWQCVYANPLDAIQKDWKAAFRSATWGDDTRYLGIHTVRELGGQAPLLHRLSPRTLYVSDNLGLRDLSTIEGLSGLQRLKLASWSELTNLDALKGLPGLQALTFVGCRRLANVDALKGLSGLQALSLEGCAGLTDVNGLKGLSGLQRLNLSGCTWLAKVNALKGLSGLQRLSLRDCPRLTNVDALKGLSGLQQLDLSGCDGLSVEAIASLRAALPNTKIIADK
jgi:hypothetical protein